MKRIIPALLAAAAALFKRTPKSKTYQAPAPKTSDAPAGPSLRGNGKASRALRQHRRFLIARSFTRFLARKPIGWRATVGEAGAAWRKGLQQWRDGWARAAKAGTTVYLGRRAQKAQALRTKLKRRAEMKRARGRVLTVAS